MRLAILTALILLMRLTFGHDLGLTVIKVDRSSSGASIQVTTPLSRLLQWAHLPGQVAGPQLDITVRERLGVAVTGPAEVKVDSQKDMLTWSAHAAGQFTSPLTRFDLTTPTSRTIVMNYENGQFRSEDVLVAEVPSPTTSGMIGTGIQHILTGMDHILFVVGLTLLGGSWKTLLKVLTAFTVAHSITLFAAATGRIHMSPAFVEPLIALSIVALAVESIRQVRQPKSDRIVFRIAIAFGFGLAHGLGFAGGLTDLGLQGKRLVANLLPFSAGIELGQILILAPATLLLLALSRIHSVRAQQFTLAASICVGMIGCFWFAERLF